MLIYGKYLAPAIPVSRQLKRKTMKVNNERCSVRTKRVLLPYTFFLWVFFFSGFSCLALDQTDTKNYLQEQAVKVYLDVSGRFQEYIKTEITFVNYVRDRKEAQVYIMMTTRQTGAGGAEYTIKLIGQQDFKHVNDTVKFVSRQMDSEDMVRRGIVRVLKQGLMHYVEKTPLAEYIEISYRGLSKPEDAVDNWNYWVFNIDLDTDFSGEASKERHSLEASLAADRVTAESKISMGAGYDYMKRVYDFGENVYLSISHSKYFRGLYVKSLTDHWSAGMYANISSSSYTNDLLSADLAPAVEYNIFPYSDYTRREFRLLYRVAWNNVRYEEETIYDKIRETLFYQSLSATFEFKERWGSLSASLLGLNYLHDLSKNRLDFSCYLNLRIFKGLSFNISGDISMIHDQLSLPKRGATKEEILLHRKQIATDYDYYVSTGFRYTFGSIYSNVVNPRFGGGRRW